MLNGHLPSPWSESNYVEITIEDWFENKISMPAVSSLSLVFSLANMTKAAIYLNVYKTYGTERKFTSHRTISSFFCSTLLVSQIISEGKIHLVGKVFDHLPFFITSLTFRLVTYKNFMLFEDMHFFG